MLCQLEMKRKNNILKIFLFSVNLGGSARVVGRRNTQSLPDDLSRNSDLKATEEYSSNGDDDYANVPVVPSETLDHSPSSSSHVSVNSGYTCHVSCVLSIEQSVPVVTMCDDIRSPISEVSSSSSGSYSVTSVTTDSRGKISTTHQLLQLSLQIQRNSTIDLITMKQNNYWN